VRPDGTETHSRRWLLPETCDRQVTTSCSRLGVPRAECYLFTDDRGGLTGRCAARRTPVDPAYIVFSSRYGHALRQNEAHAFRADAA
jgi:hypothetical protein